MSTDFFDALVQGDDGVERTVLDTVRRFNIADELLPLARRVKCVPASMTLEALLDTQELALPSDGDSSIAGPRLQALRLLEYVARLYRTARALAAEPGADPAPMLGRYQDGINRVMWSDAEMVRVVYSRAFYHCLGYMRALVDVAEANGGRAAAGRRSMGEIRRNAIREAAQKWRHLSRERAAVEIAKEVNLSSGTVRRHLSTMFKGDAWSA